MKESQRNQQPILFQINKLLCFAMLFLLYTFCGLSSSSLPIFLSLTSHIYLIYPFSLMEAITKSCGRLDFGKMGYGYFFSFNFFSYFFRFLDWFPVHFLFLFNFFYRCKHYRRRCKIRAPCCNEIFSFRHCHNKATVLFL